MVAGLMIYMKCKIDWHQAAEQAQARSAVEQSENTSMDTREDSNYKHDPTPKVLYAQLELKENVDCNIDCECDVSGDIDQN